MVFKYKIRTHKKPKLYSESEFGFLNRSGLKHCGRIRKLINKWMTNYPKKHKKEIINRIKASNNLEFRSALFELYLFNFLLMLGYKVEFHPNLEAKKKQIFSILLSQTTRSHRGKTKL